MPLSRKTLPHQDSVQPHATLSSTTSPAVDQLVAMAKDPHATTASEVEALSHPPAPDTSLDAHARRSAQQASPLFRLPPEIRTIIYEMLFYAMKGPDTIAPQFQDIPLRTQRNEDDGSDSDEDDAWFSKNKRKGSKKITPTVSSKFGMTPIMETCQQIKLEVVHAWCRLPQSFRSLRKRDTDVFGILTSRTWRQFHDLTIFVAANWSSLPLCSAVSHKPRDQHPDPYTCEAILGFAQTLSSSLVLKRLTIVPTNIRFASYEKAKPSPPPQSRIGIRPLWNLLTMLKPLAYLPAHVSIEIVEAWEGFEKTEWLVKIREKNHYDMCTRLINDAFNAMRNGFAGDGFEDTWQWNQWEIRVMKSIMEMPTWSDTRKDKSRRHIYRGTQRVTSAWIRNRISSLAQPVTAHVDNSDNIMAMESVGSKGNTPLMKPGHQMGPLFTLALEIRIAIYELVFFSTAREHTIRPQKVVKNKNQDRHGIRNSDPGDHDHSGPTKQGVEVQKHAAQNSTALLSTCHQINLEVSDTWRRLPQSYQSLRVRNNHFSYRTTLKLSNTFELLSVEVWRGLRDLMINIGVVPTDNTRSDALLRNLHLGVGVRGSVVQIFTIFKESCTLRRLHIVPSVVEGGPHPWLKYFTRAGGRVIEDLWTILKPLAYLSEEIAVTTTSHWAGCDNEHWLDDEGVEGEYAGYARQCEKGLLALHKKFAGKTMARTIWHGGLDPSERAAYYRMDELGESVSDTGA